MAEEEKERRSKTKCPFCQRDGFDLPGLKNHLQRNQCEVYLNTDTWF